jgi:hypothetical protein
MSTPCHIKDGSGSSSKAKVTSNGQLITSPLSYDLTQFIELAEPNTAYSFYPPKTCCNFIITGFIAKADKQVSSTVDADVVIYEAGSDSTTTVDKVLFQTAMTQGDQVIANPLNILVNVGKFVNVKTTDDDIHVTIMGYYVPEAE